ncbi:hypothetical protein ACFFIY_07625 [Bhargavaea ullalensis]|uniref:Uncharacterized protein n=1 Tax=Bhargavaea ullalensis TaxID=1265685 RepID=A0ABV2GAY0_9BACL
MALSLGPGLLPALKKSIRNSFIRYMDQRRWNEEAFDSEDFLAYWKRYVTFETELLEELPKSLRANAGFHASVAQLINETVSSVVEEPPSEDLIAEIEWMQEKLDTQYQYACRSEATYVHSLLAGRLK